MSLLINRVANRINRRDMSDLKPFRDRYDLSEPEARLYFGIVNLFNDKGGEPYQEINREEIVNYTGLSKSSYTLRAKTLVERKLITRTRRRSVNGYYIEFNITNRGLSFLQHNL